MTNDKIKCQAKGCRRTKKVREVTIETIVSFTKAPLDFSELIPGTLVGGFLCPRCLEQLIETADLIRWMACTL